MRSSVAACGLFLLAVLSASCAPPKPESAADYYRLATQAMEEKSYELAVKYYKGLLDEYPFSDYAAEAELKAALAQYMDGQYPEAIAALTDFQRMHPTSSDMPMVEYYLGMSSMKQMRSIDRDQSATAEAHRHFRLLLERFPESPWAAKARTELERCREALAGHEFYIARFYLRSENQKAAEARLAGLLEQYPETRVASEALRLFAGYYRQRGLAERARLAEEALGSLPAGAEAPARHAASPTALAGRPAETVAALVLALRSGNGSDSRQREASQDIRIDSSRHLGYPPGREE